LRSFAAGLPALYGKGNGKDNGKHSGKDNGKHKQRRQQRCAKAQPAWARCVPRVQSQPACANEKTS
jgi:hypothetical protein